MAKACLGDSVRFRSCLRVVGEADTVSGPQDIGPAVLGAHGLMPGVAKLLVGMRPGETRRAILSPPEAFGAFDPCLRMQVNRSELPPNVRLEVGMRLRTCVGEGRICSCRVAEVTPDHVILDANHPRAGLTLAVEVTLLGIERGQSPGPSGAEKAAALAAPDALHD